MVNDQCVSSQEAIVPVFCGSAFRTTSVPTEIDVQHVRFLLQSLCVCVCVCVRACVRPCVRASVHASVCACECNNDNNGNL